MSKNFASWARQMVNEFGQNVKKHLRGLYKAIFEFDKRQARRGAISFKDVDKKTGPVVLKSVSEMTDEDFINPSRSILLPSLPDNTLKSIGSEKKPVLIKQNILEKNLNNHKELSPEDSKRVLNTALYDGELAINDKPLAKSDYWVLVKVGDKNSIVVVDTQQTKDNTEVVGWRLVDEKGLNKLKRRAEREGGQILITKSEDTQGAADRLSALSFTSSTSSIPKTETEVKPADKKTRLVKPKDFQWEKIDKDTYLLQFTDPDNGDIETVAKLVRNKTGKGSHKWNWAGTNRGFLDAVSAKSVVKSNVFERVKRSKHEQRKAKRIAAREMAKEEKKLEKAQEYIKAGEKKAEPEEALPKTLKEKIDYFLERGEIMFFDIWAPVRRLQEKIEGEKGEKLSDDLNLYQKLELISGKIEENIKETKAKYFDPIIKILKENKIEVKDFNRFLYVSHAEERNNAIAKRPDNPFALTGEPGSGITTEQANKELKKYEALPNYEAYVKAAALSYELNNFLLDEQVRLGMMTEKQQKAYGKYQKYTPLKSPPDQGFILDKQALGRRSEASEQLAYIEQAIHATYSRAYKKDIAGTAIKLFSLFPNKEMYEQVKPQMVQYLDKKGNARIKQAMDKFFGNPEMIWVKDPSTGKYTVFRIKDKFLRDAVIGREKNDAIESKVFRGFAAVNRWLAGMATAYNPEFIYTNLFRDVQQGAAVVDVNLPEGSVKKFLGNLKRAKQAIADSRAGKVTEDTKLLKEFLLGGGMTGYSEFMKLENRAAAIEAEVSSAIKGGKAHELKQAFKKSFEFIEAWNDAIETRTRLAGYMTAKEAGLSVQKSAAFAKNMTVNFNKKGSWAPVLNSLFLFSSASLGGTMVTANLLVKASKTPRGKKMIAGAIGQDAITGYHISDNSVTGDKLVDDAVTAEKLADEAVTAPKILDGSVVNSKITDGAITEDKLGFGSVTSNKILLDSILSHHIYDGQIITDKIANGAITSDKILFDAVTTDKIPNGAITPVKLDALANWIFEKLFVTTLSTSAVKFVEVEELPSTFLGGIVFYDGAFYAWDNHGLGGFDRIATEYDLLAIPNNASFTLTGLGERDFASLTNKPTSLSGYGITDALSPEHHASEQDTYGLGSTTEYGHVKTINNLEQQAHAAGTALSAYQGNVLKNSINAKLDTAGGTITGDLTVLGNVTGTISTATMAITANTANSANSAVTATSATYASSAGSSVYSGKSQTVVAQSTQAGDTLPVAFESSLYPGSASSYSGIYSPEDATLVIRTGTDSYRLEYDKLTLGEDMRQIVRNADADKNLPSPLYISGGNSPLTGGNIALGGNKYPSLELGVANRPLISLLHNSITPVLIASHTTIQGNLEVTGEIDVDKIYSNLSQAEYMRLNTIDRASIPTEL